MNEGDPPWMRELALAFDAVPQFALSGNVHDFQLFNDRDSGRSSWLSSLTDAVEVVCRESQASWLVTWDPVNGFREQTEFPSSGMGFEVLGVASNTSPETVELTRAVSNMHDQSGRDELGVLIVDFASRLAISHHEEAFARLLVIAEKLGYRGQLRQSDRIIWILDSPGDFPVWFSGNSSFLRTIEIPLPSSQARRVYASTYIESLANETAIGLAELTTHVEAFVEQTSGLELVEIKAIYELCRSRKLGPSEIEQATRAYRVGVLENPWRDQARLSSIGNAFDIITTGEWAGHGDFPAVVYGQDGAVLKTADILMRSSLGLTAAHTGGNQRRPRGVLFFAGPTGVGKTQLAKAVNLLVFDSDDPIVFDMSEFSEEHAQARLLGAPPGYVGHESGGELTSAIRQRPFSVVLFDEIEKASARLLDKFLQLLDEGRMTDGLGQTVYFTEALIIFTSNLGMHEIKAGTVGGAMFDERGRPQKVMKRPGDDPVQFRDGVLNDIKRAFVEDLGRPELLNRIGEENIVVFDFITPEVGSQIFNHNLRNVERRVSEQLNVSLTISDSARHALCDFALHSLDMGGRGIGNAVETSLVNPLARALFSVEYAEKCHVASAAPYDGVWQLEIETT